MKSRMSLKCFSYERQSSDEGLAFFARTNQRSTHRPHSHDLIANREQLKKNQSVVCVLISALIIVSACLISSGCSDDGKNSLLNPPLALEINDIQPKVILPQTKVFLFADGQTSQANYRLKLRIGATVYNSVIVYKDEEKLYFKLPDGLIDGVGEGPHSLMIEAIAENEWGATTSKLKGFNIHLEKILTPHAEDVAQGIIFVNSEIAVNGGGLLLDAAEGESLVEIEGCFLAEGRAGVCPENGRLISVQKTLHVDDALRKRGYFYLSPDILGIYPGRFEGKVVFINRFGNGVETRSDMISMKLDLKKTQLAGFVQSSISLGQYLDIKGKGFVGRSRKDAISYIVLRGNFYNGDNGLVRAININMPLKFIDGESLRFVLDEDSEMSQTIDVRNERGIIRAKATPIIRYLNEQLKGDAQDIVIEIAPVKQVVYVRFLSSWYAGLKKFGLQAADEALRKRIFYVLERTYRSVNVEFRKNQPEDFALYATLDIAGYDPNKKGLLGYDNTPGKDINNKRLQDFIGGVNALTQENGDAGYGGVFVNSILGFSYHPPEDVPLSGFKDALFDDIFDPLRPDTGVEASTSEVISIENFSVDGNRCPAEKRLEQIACGIYVLGNIVGQIAAHELGHSLGLAQPYVNIGGYHNAGERDNRLMDAGGARPFVERAEILGAGPPVFCQENYFYLQSIHPTEESDPELFRPSCN